MNIELKGRIDSGNAPKIEAELLEQLKDNGKEPVILDAAELNYISSAGLRVILRIKKTYTDLSIINVNSDVYETFEMTGFTEMMHIEKAYKVVSIEGCEEVGRGANGTIYRIDKDNVVKVYNNADALEDIQHEREVAKLALILGIPTAISYDVVRVGESYGSVFEFLNAQSFAKIMVNEPDKLDWCVQEFVKMLKIIHSTVVPEGKLPDMKETALKWAQRTSEELPAEAGAKLIRLFEEVPRDNHMIHGDYHTKNLVFQNDEVLLIDMDTLAVGHPVFELGPIYNALQGFSEYDHDVIIDFQGYNYETATTFWKKFLALYLKTTDEKIIRDVENKARIVGYSRLIRRTLRKGDLTLEKTQKELALWKERLLELLDVTDTLIFDEPADEINNNELEIEAKAENLNTVLDFVDKKLEAVGCSPRTQMQVDLAVEEIFINIAHYAYAPGTGNAIIRTDINDDNSQLKLTFIDRGMPYDPLKRDDPDLTLPADERDIGGLGIFMTKKSVDDIFYEYRDGCNILVVKKNL